jgi:hypothetical protein
MHWRVAEARATSDSTLHVRFLDGVEGEVDLGPMIRSERAGVFAALANPETFRNVRVELGAVAWPGDLDLAPDAMHAAIAATGHWIP